jgi:hypothetical protein
MVIFPAGVLSESSMFIRLLVLAGAVIIFLATKKNLVYPSILSSIILALLNNYL